MPFITFFNLYVIQYQTRCLWMLKVIYSNRSSGNYFKLSCYNLKAYTEENHVNVCNDSQSSWDRRIPPTTKQTLTCRKRRGGRKTEVSLQGLRLYTVCEVSLQGLRLYSLRQDVIKVWNWRNDIDTKKIAALGVNPLAVPLLTINTTWTNPVSPPPPELLHLFSLITFYLLVSSWLSWLVPLSLHTTQTSTPPAGFEPAISACERPQTLTLDRSHKGIGII
jgi:hypothetical protein